MKYIPETRILVRREYEMVACLLRDLFKVPDNEMILSIEWDKSNGVLRLLTLRDYDKNEQEGSENKIYRTCEDCGKKKRLRAYIVNKNSIKKYHVFICKQCCLERRRKEGDKL